MPASSTLSRPPAEAGATPGPDRLRPGRSGDLREFTVSLERPAPWRYLLDALYPPHGRRERWRLAVARRLPWRWAAGRVLSGVDAAGTPPLLGELAARPRLLAAAVPGGERLAWIARRRPDQRGGETAYLFAGDAPAPVVVVELRRPGVATDSGAATDCGTEAAALGWVADHLPPDLAATVPRVLCHRVEKALEVLSLSALPGPSAYVELRRRPGSRALLDRHLEAAATWLTAFQGATRSGEPWRLPPWSEAAPPALAAAAEPEWWASLAAALERRPLPRVARHGDLWPRNLLPDPAGGLPRVVDWRDLQPDAAPLDDLFDFALTAGELHAGVEPGDGDGFLHAFAGDGAVARRVWRFVERVLAGLGVDPDLGRRLLAVHLLLRAGGVVAGAAPPGRLARERPPGYWLACWEGWRP